MRADDGWVVGLGTVLVVAPHPDDESLGCGGLIAMLRVRSVAVSVVLVSDGTMSHPGSRRFPAPARRRLREDEMRRALHCLGVDATCLSTLGAVDGEVPGVGAPGFEPAAAALAATIAANAARTLVVPWRRDAHPDHRASFEIACAAAALSPCVRRVLEYAVWLDERGGVADQPRRGEATAWRLDVSAALAQKARAIAAHRSQRGAVFVDDPAGFALSPHMIERALVPVETYFEVLEPATAATAA